nr:hypothetical protein [Tanacetum cinerariifolium]
DGKPITCWECEGPLRGGFCLFCNSKAENSFTYDPGSFNITSSNFNHLLQPQLCGNDSHYGYDCPPQFLDDESLYNEDVPLENFKSYSNPLFDDKEINSDEIDPHCFNAESNLIKSLSNRDNLFDYSPKFDYLEEISGELMPASIVNEERIKREHEEYISLMEKLLTINSFPRPLENVHANMIIETLPTSHIPIEDSDSLREEIDIFTESNRLLT